MTPERMREIEARAEKATPGPWKWWTSNSWRRLRRDDRGVAQTVAEPYVARDHHPDLTINEEDMAFIAHARTDIPDLLAALQAVTKELREAEAALVSYADGNGHRDYTKDYHRAAIARARSREEASNG